MTVMEEDIQAVKGSAASAVFCSVALRQPNFAVCGRRELLPGLQTARQSARRSGSACPGPAAALFWELLLVDCISMVGWHAWLLTPKCCGRHAKPFWWFTHA
jgi:hypothetical protein